MDKKKKLYENADTLFYNNCQERFEEFGAELFNLRNDIEDWNEFHQDDRVDKFYDYINKICEFITGYED